MLDRPLGRVGWLLGVCLQGVVLGGCAALATTPGGQGDAALSEEVCEMIRARSQAELEQIVALGLPGASLAVVLPDGQLLTLSAGLADADTGAPLRSDGLMLSGSVGKTYVVGVLLRLVSEGRLDLDAPLTAAFGDTSAPWWDRLPNVRDVTLRQLSRHASGLPRYVFHPEFGPALAAEPERVWTPEQCLAFVYDSEPLFEPGQGFAYADTNYLLVGLAIEAVTGRPFYELAREWLLEPHDLRATRPTDRVDVPGVVQGHVVSGRAMGIGPRTREHGRFTYNVQFEWCGGGWASTPGDLARWAALLYSGRAVPGESLSVLLDTLPADELGPGLRYGPGTMLRATAAGALLGHDGYMPGYLTAVGHLPDHDLTLALMLNSDDSQALGRRPGEVLAGLAEDLALLLAAEAR